MKNYSIFCISHLLVEIIGREGIYARYQPNLMGDILDIKISVSDSLAKVYLGFKVSLVRFKWDLSKRKTTARLIRTSRTQLP